MRLLLAFVLAIFVPAAVLLALGTFEEDRSPSAKWGLAETVSVLLREWDRREVLAQGLPQVMEREQAETALFEVLIARRISLREAIGRVYAARSPEELVCFLERLRLAVPGASDDERVGRHLIQVVKEWGWNARHGIVPWEGPLSYFDDLIIELEAQLHDSLLAGPQGNQAHVEPRP
jgi:hypothetical protein